MVNPLLGSLNGVCEQTRRGETQCAEADGTQGALRQKRLVARQWRRGAGGGRD